MFFNEAIKKNFILTYGYWTTDRKPFDTAREFQRDISPASNISSPLYFITTHQKHKDLILLILIKFFQKIDLTILFSIMSLLEDIILKLTELDILKTQL